MIMGSAEKELAISIKNVGAFYQRRLGFLLKDKFWALNNVSFDVHHGETLGVIGRNGVGKSTLLRLLAGIITPNRGEVVNHDVRVSMLSLQVGFLGHLTGRENAILSGMMLGLSKAEVLAQIDNIQTYADIGDFFDQPLQWYSTGMQARLGFSVAVYTNPDVILLDEVLGVGDQDFRKKSTRTMKEIIDTDKTIILVSHSMKLINDHCDRVLWLENGSVRAIGKPENVISQYNNLIES
jgi:lipopolysaccharide transport system ATP-binding protein